MSYATIKGRLDGVTDAGPRIYLLVAPQSAPLPFIVLQRISQVPLEQTFDGPTDIEPARYQVAYWTGDARTVPAAEASIRSALDGIEGSFTEGISDDSEPPASGEARSHVTRFEVELVATQEV